MRMRSRHQQTEALPGLVGSARLDRKIGALVRRLRPGDVAVIDHVDLDRASAESLLDCGVSVVVNAAPFISGRYPNLGPELLVRAGVVLIDNVGADVFSRLADGTKVRVHEGRVFAGDQVVAEGPVLDADVVAELMTRARSGLSLQLESFTHNTTEFLRREQDLLLHGEGVPKVRTGLSGRPVVIVTRAYDYRSDLKRLRRFIKEQRPVLIGVDGGVEAIREAGHEPDIAVMGPGSLAQRPAAEGSPRPQLVSDRALRGVRDVVIHADRVGRAVGAERLERLGVKAQTFAASGTTEDVALLLADLSGASVIVTVGMHTTLDEFLDRERSGLASTFLTRLRIGPKLVDAKGVPHLYAGRVRGWHLALVLLVGVLSLLAALWATPVGQGWLADAGDRLSQLWEALLDRIQGLVS